MTKKIIKSMLMVVLLSVSMFGLGTSFLFYETNKNQTIEVVKAQSALIQSKYDELSSIDETLDLNEIVTQSRITIIDEAGNVVFDNKTAVDSLDNHNDRFEIIQARNRGFGEQERISKSLMQKYYYYAVLLDNGSVLRVSSSLNSFYALMVSITPFTISALFVIVAIARGISKRLAYNIIAPIEKADFNSNLTSPYRELDLHYNTLREQKLEIEKQMARVNRRKETINTILNTMQEGFVIVDENNNVFLANQAYLKMMNIKQYTVGESIYRFITDRVLLDKIKQSFNNQSSSHLIELGSKIYKVYISNSNITNENVSILLFVDISLEYENQKHREQFSANVSHELKTPLTSIKGLAELQANDMVKAEDVKLFGEKILKQSDRLLELIDHTIRLSKFDEDAIDPKKEIINLKFIADEVIEYLHSKIESKNIKIINQVDDIDMYGNYQMIDELYFNLIDNAIKYNDENGYVRITTKLVDDKILIEIVDNGHKISKSDIPRLFERFYRTDSSRDKKTGGTGLGLAIVKHIVMYHNGVIDVESDRETKFIIHLPLRGK